MDTPKNCNECHFHDNCNSYYRGLGCRFRKAIKPVSAIILALCLAGIPTINALSEYGKTVETEVAVVNAEDIGIVANEVEVEEEEPDILEETEEEFDEESEVKSEKIPGEIVEETKPEKEPAECKITHCVYYDEDSGFYVLEEWCDICGDGTETVISDEEFEALGVESDVEF